MEEGRREGAGKFRVGYMVPVLSAGDLDWGGKLWIGVRWVWDSGRGGFGW